MAAIEAGTDPDPLSKRIDELTAEKKALADVLGRKQVEEAP